MTRCPDCHTPEALIGVGDLSHPRCPTCGTPTRPPLATANGEPMLATDPTRLHASKCTHPNCELHGKSRCEGVDCLGRDTEDRANDANDITNRVQANLATTGDPLATHIPIPGSACEHCGNQLGFRSGIGRVVITHATGNDKCYPNSPTAMLTTADTDTAQNILNTIEALLVAHQNRSA